MDALVPPPRTPLNVINNNIDNSCADVFFFCCVPPMEHMISTNALLSSGISMSSPYSLLHVHSPCETHRKDSLAVLLEGILNECLIQCLPHLLIHCKIDSHGLMVIPSYKSALLRRHQYIFFVAFNA